MSLEETRSTHSVPTLSPIDDLERERRQPNGPDDTAEPEGQFPSPHGSDRAGDPDASHEGGTEEEVGDRTGPGAGYDQEPEQERDRGGVA